MIPRLVSYIRLPKGIILFVILPIKFLHMRLTLVVKKGQSGYLIGQLKEMPEVFTQGKTIEELKENILDALDLYLEDLREDYHPTGEIIQEDELILV
jgi:predicted RNase H-like HicB family nuclease